jgi:hypothetical protein
MEYSKKAYAICKIIEVVQMTIGIVMAALFGLVFIVSLTDDNTDEIGYQIIVLLFAVLGVMLIIFSRKRNVLLKNLKAYYARLLTDKTGSITSLANSLHIPKEVVTANLEKMIDKKLFPLAYIDEKESRIVFPRSTIGDYITKGNTSNLEYIAVTCKNCGGISKVIKGRVIECEFCGSIIQG